MTGGGVGSDGWFTGALYGVHYNVNLLHSVHVTHCTLDVNKAEHEEVSQVREKMREQDAVRNLQTVHVLLRRYVNIIPIFQFEHGTLPIFLKKKEINEFNF